MTISDLPATTDDTLLDELSPIELIRYSQTCRSAHAAVQSYMKRAFRIDRVLERYFTEEEIIQFRELQCHTGTLISGSTALQFFDRTNYPESDLDLYAEHRFSRAVVDWLLEIGYKYTPLRGALHTGTLEELFEANPPEREFVPDTGISEQIIFNLDDNDYAKAPWVFSFEKQKPYRKIQLITSLQSPLMRIFKFHSTCVMNIITHEKAYSFYPKKTFVERCSLVRRRERTHERDLALQKYSYRGWSFVSFTEKTRRSRETPPSFAEVMGPRYVGDGSCWTIPLSPSLSLPRSCVESNSWTTNFSPRSPYYDNQNFWNSFSILATKSLKFSYLMVEGDEDLTTRVVERIESTYKDTPENSIHQDDELLTLIKDHRANLNKENAHLGSAIREVEVPQRETELKDHPSGSE